VAESGSWRGVLRHLGLASTSSSAIRTARRQAEGAGLDYSHFVRPRRVTDTHLRSALGDANSWSEVSARLGLGADSERRLKAHAQRLGIDTAHLLTDSLTTGTGRPASQPLLNNLRHAAPLLAAASLRMRGHHVSWPLEPARYDLLADLGGEIVRVQVKTTTHQQQGRWTVWLSSTSPTRTVYADDEVDAFYVIDGDMTHYWLPLERVAGYQAVALTAYSDCVLDSSPA